jgi:hypothetical protein
MAQAAYADQFNVLGNVHGLITFVKLHFRTLLFYLFNATLTTFIIAAAPNY